MEEPLYRNEDVLRTFYTEQKLTTRQIAKKLECSQKTISIWLRKYDIPRRYNGGCGTPTSPGDPILYTNKGWLCVQYIDMDMTTDQMAQLAGCTAATIGNWLRHCNIRKPPRLYANEPWLYRMYVTLNKKQTEVAHLVGVSPGTIANWLKKFSIQRPKPYTNKDWLYDQYILKGNNIIDVAVLAGVGELTIQMWLRRFGIRKRGLDPLTAYPSQTIAKL